MEQMQKPERVYFFVLAALAAFLGIWKFPELRNVSVGSFVFFWILGTLAGVAPVYLQRGAVCPTTIVVGYMVIVLHGAAVALWTTGVAALAAAAIRRFRKAQLSGDRYSSWHIPQECLAAGIAGLAFEFAGGTASVSGAVYASVPLVVSGVVYFLAWGFFDVVGELLRRGIQPIKFWFARAK